MLNKLQQIIDQYERLGERLSRPDVLSDQRAYRDLSREHKRLGGIVEVGDTYRAALAAGEEARELLLTETDEELLSLAQAQLEEAESELRRLEQVLKLLLVPRDPADYRNCIIEIRAGTGGDEAALFAADLLRMYGRYAEARGWKVDPMQASEGSLGGFKEVIFAVSGEEVYGTMKYEGGVHRVQRVPATESQGRVHTSAASVAVLPEAEEVDLEIDPGDLRIDVYRSSGPGGQSVNTTDSAVRVTHLPTDTVVTCQDEKSQHKNKEKALKVLRSRLYERKLAEDKAQQDSARRSQVSTGDRSAKIRTYNFPQNRVTDHRINLTLYKLEQVIAGELHQLLEALRLADMESRLENEASGA